MPLLSLGNTLGAMIIAYLFLHFFWFFGINGSSVVGAVFNPVLRALSIENLDAYKMVWKFLTSLPVNSKTCSATLVVADPTLSLILVMVIICKSQRIKNYSQLSLVPGIFGINEPIIFGLPIVLNPNHFDPICSCSNDQYHHCLFLYGFRIGCLHQRYPASLDDTTDHFWIFSKWLASFDPTRRFDFCLNGNLLSIYQGIR